MKICYIPDIANSAPLLGSLDGLLGEALGGGPLNIILGDGGILGNGGLLGNVGILGNGGLLGNVGILGNGGILANSPVGTLVGQGLPVKKRGPINRTVGSFTHGGIVTFMDDGNLRANLNNYFENRGLERGTNFRDGNYLGL